MFLNRDQVVAMDCVRSIGFDPVQALVLTSHSRKLRYGITSVVAVKDGKRYNLRVGIDPKTYAAHVVSAHEITYVFDTRRSTDMSTVEGCVIKDVARRLVNL